MVDRRITLPSANSQASDEAGRVAQDLQSGADELSSQATTLQQQIDTYIQSVRA